MRDQKHGFGLAIGVLGVYHVVLLFDVHKGAMGMDDNTGLIVGPV